MFIPVQIAAGLAAAFGYTELLGTPPSLEVALGFSNVTAGGCELLYTFMLCFVVLNVAVAKKKETKVGNDYFGVATWCFLYMMFEIFGAMLAVGCFFALRPEEMD